MALGCSPPPRSIAQALERVKRCPMCRHACKSYTCLFFNTADDAEAPASQALVGLSPEVRALVGREPQAPHPASRAGQRLRSRAEDMARQLKDALAEAASARAECSGLAQRLSARDDAARAATEQLEGERANVAALTEEARSLRSDLHLEQVGARLGPSPLAAALTRSDCRRGRGRWCSSCRRCNATRSGRASDTRTLSASSRKEAPRASHRSKPRRSRLARPRSFQRGPRRGEPRRRRGPRCHQRKGGGRARA